MLGNFLYWVSGEHTEATANDSAENKLLLNNQESKEGRTQPSSPLSAPSSDQQLFSTAKINLRTKPKTATLARRETVLTP